MSYLIISIDYSINTHLSNNQMSINHPDPGYYI